jgi:isopenicillin N synthase-like dioxygenase
MTSNDDDDIPRIDLSQDETVVVEELMTALQSIGFATLVNHGVEPGTLQSAFGASKDFFSLPLDTKQGYKFQGHESNRGYITMGSETHDLQADCPPDPKETFDIGKEDEPGFGNFWPEELKETPFRKDLLDYFQSMDGLYLRLMRLIGTGLQLPDPEYLVQRCNAQHENLRLLHYPALLERDSTNSKPRVRGNVHTDFGTLTLLVQDQVGGLQVRHANGTWIHVQPVPHAIIVNVGDMLMRWTNDQLKATLHQVVTPKTGHANDTNDTNSISERYSIAFFCNANKDTLLECLEPCCSTPERPAKYAPVNAHEYLTERLTDTIQN